MLDLGINKFKIQIKKLVKFLFFDYFYIFFRLYLT